MKYVNCTREYCTHYCGRRSSLHKALGEPTDLSILGNPAPLRSESTREEEIREYAEYLVDLCKKNKYIVEILRAIPNDAVLGCFCFPKNCHCSVIIEASKYYKQMKDK
jgi:hypothetical protein